MNTIGSYKCTCPAGYVSNSAGICEGEHVSKTPITNILRNMQLYILVFPQTFEHRLNIGLHASLVHVCTVNVGTHALNTPTLSYILSMNWSDIGLLLS